MSKEQENDSGSRVTSPSAEVSIHYLTYLHDMLAESTAKLEQLFGGSASMMLYEVAADQVQQTLREKGAVEPGLEGALRALAGWGMKTTTKHDGELLEIGLECPYARLVHPGFSSDNPRCPLGPLLLGAAREKYPGAGLKSELTSTGASFTILRPRFSAKT